MKLDKRARLTMYKQEISRIEKELERENRVLRALPAKMGYKSIDALIEALQSVQKGGKKTATEAGAKRTRANLTPELKQKIKAAVEADKTSAVVAKQLGVSIATVHNVKKSFGLVKKRR